MSADCRASLLLRQSIPGVEQSGAWSPWKCYGWYPGACLADVGAKLIFENARMRDGAKKCESLILIRGAFKKGFLEKIEILSRLAGVLRRCQESR